MAISHLGDYNTLIVSNLDLTASIEESFEGVMLNSNIVFLIIFMLAAILTGPLLFFFVKWSRELLVGVLAVVLGMQFIDGLNGSYYVVSDLEVLAFNIEALTHGAILAIAYLTPIKEKFK
ncbi:hypothetical protein N9J68_02860 [Gammaproteobacteria bacterium]|nr:hypothetical protein [Gammaproteobacteria bacterium]MDA9117584.1 hypothetical protein [Gammaproteobacteria bacterium]